LADQLGIEITRFNSKESDRSKLAHFLLSRKVNLVFDVGANVGQYGRELRAIGYGGRIISFEPISAAHAQLNKGALRDPNWIVVPRTAIGSEEGVISIKVSSDAVLSSVLRGANWLSRIGGNSMVACEEQVPLVTLNSLAPQYIKHGDVAFLKIDVGGFEYEVVHGGDKILNALCGVQFQLPLVHHGEKPFRFILDYMESKGFRLYSFGSALAGEVGGREVRFDAIFVGRGTAESPAH
jgi:FkbM family methyltransferase